MTWKLPFNLYYFAPNCGVSGGAMVRSQAFKLRCTRHPICVQDNALLISCWNIVFFSLKWVPELLRLKTFLWGISGQVTAFMAFFSIRPQLSPTDTAHSLPCALAAWPDDCHPSASLLLWVSIIWQWSSGHSQRSGQEHSWFQNYPGAKILTLRTVSLANNSSGSHLLVCRPHVAWLL